MDLRRPARDLHHRSLWIRARAGHEASFRALFRALYDLYSFAVMPFLGELIAGSRQAYTHLPETIRLFPLPDELAAILKEIGFTRVGYRSLTNGIAVIHYGLKPAG